MGILSTIRKYADKASDIIRKPFQNVGTEIATGGSVKQVGGTTYSPTPTPNTSGFTSTGGGIDVNKAFSGTSGGGSGGGGGGGTTTQPSISGVIQPITTYDAGKDVQTTKSYSGVVSTVPTGPREGYSAAKRILRDEGKQFKGKPLQKLYEAGKGFVTGSLKRDTSKSLEEVNKEQQKYQDELNRRSFTTEYITTPTGPSGTAEIRRTEVPTDILIRDAALGDKTALEIVTRRGQKDIDITVKEVAAQELSNDQQKVDNYVASIQSQIDSGQITLQQGKENLKTYASSLDEQRVKRIEEKVSPVVQAYQSRLDSAAKYGRITRLTLTTGASVAAGFVLAPAVSVLPKVVQTGIGIGTGATVAYSASKLGSRVAVGQAGVLDIAEFTLPLAGFAVGAGIKAKINARDLAKFESILKSPNLKVELKDVKALTTESQIKALHLPPEQETQLLSQFNLGRRVGVQKYDIKAPNTKQQNLINKFIPKREIISIGEIQTLSDGTQGFIQGGYLTKVKLGKGFNKYVEFQFGKYEGEFNPQTGEAVIKTTSIRTPKKLTAVEDLLEVSKTKTLIQKPEVKYIQTPEGKIIRGIKSKAITFEGAKVIKVEGKPITFKDLNEVVASERYGKYPEFKSEQMEVQQLKNLKMGIRQLEISQGDIYGVVGKEKTFTTEKAFGKTERIPQPIEFKYSRAMKPFEPEPPKIEVTKIKPQKLPELTKQQKQIFKEVEPSYPKMVGGEGIKVQDYSSYLQQREFPIEEFDYSQLPPFMDNKQILRGIQTGAGKITEGTKAPTILDIDYIQKGKFKTKDIEIGKDLLKQFEKNQIKIDELLKERTKQIPPIVIPKIRTGIKEITITAVSSVQKVSPKLDTQLKQKLAQPQQLYQPQFNIPIIVPKIDTPKFVMPKLPSFGQSAGYQKLRRQLKKATKREPSYTASLAAAAVQAKPFKITKKQYARLKRGTYTGIEARPVIEIVPEKSLKKELEKVKF